MAQANLNTSAILSYLGLPTDYEPSPADNPIGFLSEQLRYLPPNILSQFSSITTPKQRTNIPTIRNRRLRYTESNPPELSFTAAKSTWPTLWKGREPRGRDEAKEEQEWAKTSFLEGKEKHVGKLGTLLSIYEEEREAERVRSIRRHEAEIAESLPEEDSDSDSEESELESDVQEADENPAVAQVSFLRGIRERFIYGLLDSIDYDNVDWDERWDAGNDRDEEERWFDDEEENTIVDT
ncbi:hypothetical protein QCA50_000378 [Cerrena zonata]|uniref:CCD97-like C-terminal domain-containing protein n=1 Tax=Cerrena zonata TaxID=2478898 RepID=A0AAW0GYX9_9APHY